MWSTETRWTRRWKLGLMGVAAALSLAACGTSTDSADPEPAADTTTASSPTSTSTSGPTSTSASDSDSDEVLFPDVIGATAEQRDDGSWDFAATLSSPYDSAARYADAWRVVGPNGEVYGTRELAHDHAAEQPFTRGLSGVVIPDDVTEVTIEGRDQISGWGGATVTVELAGQS